MVTEIRGKGLIWAIELDRPDRRGGRQQVPGGGLLVNNVKPTALRLIPPLTVTEAEIDKAVEIIERVLAQIEAVRRSSGRPRPPRSEEDG